MTGKRQTHVSHQFVDFIPERLDEGVVYISRRYGTAVHKCCCGCGEEVVTPLNPADWSLRVDGNVITLSPSIGNWSYACQSHYLIRRSKVVWAGKMSQQRIEKGRARERATKQAYFEAINRNKSIPVHPPLNESNIKKDTPGLLHYIWMGIKRWLNL